jgi:hypothetical protein
MAAIIPSAEAVVLILTSCTAGGFGSRGWSQIDGRGLRAAADFRDGEIKHLLFYWLGQLERSCSC